MSRHQHSTARLSIAGGGVRTVQLGGLASTDDATAVLKSPQVGSSVVVTAYHAQAQAGALLHFLLPSSQLDERRRRRQPELFADSGIAQLICHVERYVQDLAGLQIHLIGGADAVDAPALGCPATLGHRNVEAARQVLDELGLAYDDAYAGGRQARRAALEIASGRLRVHEIPGRETR